MHEVTVVLDRNFGDRLVALARRRHVWIVESDENVPWARRVWDEPRDEAGADPGAAGATSFTMFPDETPEAAFIRILETVDDHHGELAHNPPWSSIEVCGVALEPRVVEALQEYGVTRIEETSGSFVAYREAA